jgi:folate-binding protein YgfZ
MIAGPSATEEYEGSRRAAGLFDFDFRAALFFTGPDRATFLHNVLSNDILTLRPGTGCYATLLTQQSKIVADAYVFAGDDRIRFDVDRALKRRAREHLEKFLVADEVEIEDPSERESALGIVGPLAGHVLRAVGVEPPRETFAHGNASIADRRAWIASIDWSGDGGFQIAAPRAELGAIRDALLSAGRSHGLVAASRETLDVLRLEAGIPWPGVDFDESHLVLEAGLERGISFSKGCYLGQEVVERASSRGHVNRRLVGLRLDAGPVPPRGARIMNDAVDVGELRSAALSPTLGRPIALGYVRREAMAPGTRLAIAGRGAEIVPLPFYHGDRTGGP